MSGTRSQGCCTSPLKHKSPSLPGLYWHAVADRDKCTTRLAHQRTQMRKGRYTCRYNTTDCAQKNAGATHTTRVSPSLAWLSSRVGLETVTRLRSDTPKHCENRSHQALSCTSATHHRYWRRENRGLRGRWHARQFVSAWPELHLSLDRRLVDVVAKLVPRAPPSRGSDP